MKIPTFFVPAFAVVSGTTQLNLTMDSMGRWSLPISARLRSSSAEVNGSVFLDIDGLHDFYFDPDPSDTPVNVEIADSLIFDDTLPGRVFTLSGNFSIPNVSDLGLWNAREASIGVGFGSAFSQGFERFIITPSGNGESGLLVLDPATPEQYAYEGQWFYVNSLRDHFTGIEASVLVGNYTASSPAEFTLDTIADSTIIPLQAFRNIVGHLERAGFSIANSTHDDSSDEISTTVQVLTRGGILTLTIWGSSGSELSQVLPPIHFETVAGTQRFRITLFPEDYIEATENAHTISILAYVEGGRNSIGTNVLRRLSLQMDYENNRIGFAEPVYDV
jgi:hypothetical protein